jgi:hypothetical protein
MTAISGGGKEQLSSLVGDHQATVGGAPLVDCEAAMEMEQGEQGKEEGYMHWETG